MGVKHHPQDAGAAFQREWVVVEGDVGVSVGLVSVGGEEGDCGLGCGYGQPPLCCPLRNSLGVGSEGAGCCWDMWARKGVVEIICIGRGKFRGLGVGRDKEVEEDWGDAGALGDSCSDVSIGGSGVNVSAAGHPPTEIGGKPAYRVMW